MIALVEQALVQHLGLLPRPSWKREIPRAIAATSRSLSTSRDQLLSRLSEEPHLAEIVAGHMMVGETHFFRHREHFEAALRWLQATANSEPTGRRFRVWSAGCSTGEEPYSLLLLLLARAPDLAERVEILGTDLDPQAIRAAETGVYGRWSFRQEALAWSHRFFRGQFPDESLSLKTELRNRVQFRCEPIERTLTKTTQGTFDLIFFRNVGIYLNEDTRARVFAGFNRILRSSGRLVVAPGDPRPLAYNFERLHEKSTCWYRPARSSSPTSALPGTPQIQESPTAKRGHLPSTQRSARSRTGPAKAAPSRSVPSNRDRRLQGTGPKTMSGSQAERSVRRASAPEQRASSPESPIEAAKKLADRGEIESALDLLKDCPGDTTLQARDILRLRGSLFFAAGCPEEALQNLRELVFRFPEDRLGRYWLGLVLLDLGSTRRARSQFCVLEERLAEQPPETRLEDGTTRARDLLQAARDRRQEVA